MKPCKCGVLQSGYSFISIIIAVGLMTSLAYEGLYAFRMMHQRHVQHQMIQIVEQALTYSRLKAFMMSETLWLIPSSSPHHAVLRLVRASQPNAAIKQWQMRESNMDLVWKGFNRRNYLTVRGSPAHLAMNGDLTVWKDGRPIARLIVSRLGRLRVINLEQHGII